MLLVLQNHCGTGVQCAENPDGNEWQAFWWTHKLVQSRKAKVLSPFPGSHWWVCPSCNFGCCSDTMAVGLCRGAAWCWVLGNAMGVLSQGRGQEGPSSPSCLGRGCAPSWVVKWVSAAAGCAASGVWREWSWRTLHSSAKTLLTLLTYSAALLGVWEAGHRWPLASWDHCQASLVAVFFPSRKFSVP